VAARSDIVSGMRHRIHVHVTWTTRQREPLIDAAAMGILERAVVLELGVVRTHVHLLLRLDPTTCIPRLLQRLKGGSSVIVNRERGSTARCALRWAKGYNIDSISPRAVPAVRAYVRDQAIRHPEQAIAQH
jgi:REP element-mobilizing transposase RayT